MKILIPVSDVDQLKQPDRDFTPSPRFGGSSGTPVFFVEVGVDLFSLISVYIRSNHNSMASCEFGDLIFQSKGAIVTTSIITVLALSQRGINMFCEAFALLIAAQLYGCVRHLRKPRQMFLEEVMAQ